MTEEDYKLAKIALAKKVTKLCADFLRETGRKNISLEVLTGGNVLTTDSACRQCYGRTINVAIDTWNNDGEDDD